MKINNKAQLEGFAYIILIIIISGFFLVMGIIMISNLNDTIAFENNSAKQTLLTNNGTSTSLTYTPTSLTGVYKNMSWIYCEGVDDYFFMKKNASISYWYTNATLNSWEHAVNSSDGNSFINGSASVLPINVFYENATDYIFCKTSAAVFVNVSIDKIKVYDDIINVTTAVALYNEGR